MTVFCIRPKGEDQIRKVSLEELEKLLDMQYLPTLEFQTPAVQTGVIKRCRKYHSSTQKQKWLSEYYRKEILTGYIQPGLILYWIDDTIGYGIFTDRDIPAQSFIGEYTGELRRFYWFKRKTNDYCFDYSAGDFTTPYLIDAGRKGNLIRFLNHSDKPNVETISLLIDGIMHIALFSTAAIPKGSQLTYDYGHGYWVNRDDPSLAMSCNKLNLTNSTR